MYGYLLSFLLLVGVGVGAYFYYINTEATIKNLNILTATQAIAAKEAEKAISQLQEEAVANEQAYADLHYNLEVALKYQDSLLRILHKHNLTNLAAKKPGMIEKRINEGTKNALDSLESTTRNE